ncbi:uncharacterized protein [Ptychodera flava]|uniref:uncharacterized protein isoform X2 n=1 Tax=Ptychodera flava TaxID=63121 RepID=UPI00396A1CF9
MAVVGEGARVPRILLCFLLLHDFTPLSCKQLSHKEEENLWESQDRRSQRTSTFKGISENIQASHYGYPQESAKHYKLTRHRRAASTAREMKSLVEDTIRDVAAKIESDYSVALYDTKCSSPGMVYNGCRSNIPGIGADDRYSVPVSMTTSSVHFSDEAQQLIYGSTQDVALNKTLWNSLCVSDGVQNKWKENFEREGISLKWQEFVDSSSGYTRVYPGVSETVQNCQDGYDPRLQSWYAGMVSPPKDVAIVIDITMETNMELMKKSAHAIIETLSKSDHGEIYFSTVANGLRSLKPATAQQRHLWHSEVNDLLSESLNSSLGDMASLAMEDLQAHTLGGSPGGCARVMVILTDRLVKVDVLYDVTNDIFKPMDARIFTYTMGQHALHNPFAKQISCDNNGVWFALQNVSDIHLISRYYQLLSEAEHLPSVLWSEIHQFRYENTTGVTGCLPATNNSNTILDNIGVACVFLEKSTFSDFRDDGSKVLTEMAESNRTKCPIRLFSKFDLKELRPENSQCDRPISRTARELKDLAENAVKKAGWRATISYPIPWTSGHCDSRKDFRDTCRHPPEDLIDEELFQRKVSTEHATTHLTAEMVKMISQDATLEDFKSNKELYSSLCAAESLDANWQTFLDESLDIRWQFYGDQKNRFIRLYPGIQDTEEQCSKKDSEAPFRTWFPSAASSPKDVIILIDVHHEEQLSLIQEAAASMVNTLTRYDFANIVSNGRELYQGMVKATKDRREEMMNFARNVSVSDTLDVIGSFEKAKALWERGNKVSGCVEAILYVSDSLLPDSDLLRIGNILQTLDSFRVFTYSIGPLADQTNLWQLACQTSGVWVNVETLYDLWKQISDYYNYFSSNEQTEKVIWSDVYEDRYGIGKVLSGCLPIYNTQSKHLSLLGVVCVDILEKTLLSYPDGNNVYQSMMGGDRRCPAIQLKDKEIEELREGDEKCERQAITSAKQLYRYTADALRRQAYSAHESYKRMQERKVTSCPFKVDIVKACPRTPPETTTKPAVAFPQQVLQKSTVLLTSSDSATITDGLAHLAVDTPLLAALCLSQPFVQTWNSYSQVAYHFFVGPRPSTKFVRVFPDVIFGKDDNFCNEGESSERILRIQKETDISSRLNPKDVLIVVQNSQQSTLDLMKRTMYTISDELTPMDQIGMVTSGGSHHINQMQFFTRDNQESFVDFVKGMKFSRAVRTLGETVEEGFTVLKTNTQHCSPILIILTDELMYYNDIIDDVAKLNKKLNATVLVYLFGKAADSDETKRIAMETACANGGAWDMITSQGAVQRVENFVKYVPSDLTSVQSPVWFEMTYDLLIPTVQSDAMVSCMPIVSDGIFLGTLCDSITKATFDLFEDGSEVFSMLKNSTRQCRKLVLSEDELSALRRDGAQCAPPKPRGMEPGAIVAVVIVVMVLVALLVVLAVLMHRHRGKITLKLRAACSFCISRDRSNNQVNVDGELLLNGDDAL